MKINLTLSLVILLISSVYSELSPDLATGIDSEIAKLAILGHDSTIVAHVKSFNSNPPPHAQTMTQEQWKKLSILSPEIKAIAKSELSLYLKSIRSDIMTEIFVSAANGNKVALLAKTTSWCHRGSSKHDLPMKGKTWKGEVETDESTGQQQLQCSFAVYDGKVPIGSIVIGLGIAQLKQKYSK